MTELKRRVKLTTRCLVGGIICEPGEIVELPDTIAQDFGQIVDSQGKPIKTSGAVKSEDNRE